MNIAKFENIIKKSWDNLTDEKVAVKTVRRKKHEETYYNEILDVPGFSYVDNKDRIRESTKHILSKPEVKEAMRRLPND